MSDTVRQSILENLIARLKLMTIANGYSVDYPVVDEWRMKALEEDDLPAVIIEDPRDQVKQTAPKVLDHELTVNIYIVVTQSTAPEKLRNYIQDLYVCLGADRTCNNYAEDITPIDDEIELQVEGVTWGIVRTTWAITYQTQAWDLTATL